MQAFRRKARELIGGFRSYSTTAAAPLVESKPIRLSAFTGKPDYYEALFFFDDILLQLKPLQQSLSITAGQSIRWYERKELSDSLGFGLTTLQHRKVKDKLSMLATYSSVPEIRQLLLNFTDDPKLATSITAEENPFQASEEQKLVDAVRIYGHLDSLGRVVAKGKRKSSTAKVYLVPGDGKLFVNGKPAVEYFSRMVDMFKLAEPFRVTGSFGKYNIWALVRGGGFTGQCGAVRLAIAKAMVVKEPKLLPTLTSWGLLKQDNRRVERKKPGQPKARKRFTWVKR